MNTKIYATKICQDEIKKNADKERELIRLIQVKSEKLCNNHLTKENHTQLSYLSKEEQAGAIAVPKGMLLDKLLNYLRAL
jgi:hypothetical protein